MKKIFFAFIVFLMSNMSVYSAGSKYSDDFKKHFIQCLPFHEQKYNVIYNANSTYEVGGFLPDGSGRCKYIETNEWLRGKNVTTCLFSPKQQQEYYNAMLNPDVKYSASIGAMPIVGAHEEVVFLKYFNDPKVCNTVGSFY